MADLLEVHLPVRGILGGQHWIADHQKVGRAAGVIALVVNISSAYSDRTVFCPRPSGHVGPIYVMG
jgi:hypothetical protein